MSKQQFARELTGRLTGYHKDAHTTTRGLYGMLDDLTAWREAFGNHLTELHGAREGLGAALGAWDKMPDDQGPGPDPDPTLPRFGTLQAFSSEGLAQDLPYWTDPRWATVPKAVLDVIGRRWAEQTDSPQGFDVVTPSPNTTFIVRAGEKVCIPPGYVMHAPVKVYEGGELMMLGSIHTEGPRYCLQGYPGSVVHVRGGCFSGADSAALMLANGSIDSVLVEQTGGDGIKISNDLPFLIQRTYVRNLGLERLNFDGQTAADLHVDAIQRSSGSAALRVILSVLDVRPGVWTTETQGGGNAGVMGRSTFGPLGPTTVEDSVILGGNYGVYQYLTSQTRPEQYPAGELSLKNVGMTAQRYGRLSTQVPHSDREPAVIQPF